MIYNYNTTIQEYFTENAEYLNQLVLFLSFFIQSEEYNEEKYISLKIEIERVRNIVRNIEDMTKTEKQQIIKIKSMLVESDLNET